jgi:hypothetical protein
VLPAHGEGSVSGPKSTRYRVVSASETQRRARARAQGRLERAQARLATVAKRAEEARSRYGEQVTAVTAGSQGDTVTTSRQDDADVAAAADRTEAAAAAAEARLRAELAAARAHVVAVALRTTGTAATRVADLVSPATAPPAPDTDALAVTAARIMSRLDPDTPEDTANRLIALAGAVPNARGARHAEQLLDELRQDVRQAGRAAARERQRAERLAALAARLDGRTGPAVEAARAALATVDGEPDWSTVEQQVAEAAAAADRAADRGYAARAMTAALTELGYDVQEGFDVLLAERGSAYLRPHGWTDHAVRVSARSDEAALRFAVVTGADSLATAETDAAAEQEWCQRLDHLVPALHAAGVELAFSSRIPPGALHVERTELPFGAAADRGRATARREREAR